MHRLGDLTDRDRPITYGVVKPGDEDALEGVALVRGGDIFEGGINTGLRTITQLLSSQYKRTILRGGELVISLVGNPGHVAVVPAALAGANLARQAGLIALGAMVEPTFLMYYFMSPRGRAVLTSRMKGSVQVVINLADLRDIEVPVPDLLIQRRIASILSTYDDLIENCQRRIRILEDMARRLYREWFVHFRFPGADNLPRVDSPLGPIPQGWAVRKLGDVLQLNYDKALKKETRRDGSVPVFGSSGVVGQHDESLAAGPGIIVGRKGNVGSVFWCDEPFFVIDTAYYVTASLPLRFLFYDLQKKNFINNDSAVPGLSRHQAYALDTLIPPANLLSQFCQFADCFEAQAATHLRQITNLRRTRDLLLPRLLSGQIDVGLAGEAAPA